MTECEINSSIYLFLTTALLISVLPTLLGFLYLIYISSIKNAVSIYTRLIQITMQKLLLFHLRSFKGQRDSDIYEKELLFEVYTEL